MQLGVERHGEVIVKCAYDDCPWGVIAFLVVGALSTGPTRAARGARGWQTVPVVPKNGVIHIMSRRRREYAQSLPPVVDREWFVG